MIYRICEYNTKEFYKGQVFNYIIDEFQLSPKKTTLIKVGTIDLQKQLNSHLDTCLSNILMRFLQPQSLPINYVDERRRKVDLIELGNLIATANELRDKYDLSDDLFDNPINVFEYIENLSKENAIALDKSMKGSDNNGKKKENINEEIKKDIQENSK